MAADFTWAWQIAARYNVAAGIPYSSFGPKLDVYQPFERGAPRPTLMFMHGGGWAEGSTKETWSLWFLPFLQLGWVVVNVDYRHSGEARAPAAVEDCLQALRWMTRNANDYQIDTRQVVIAGLSAGGHLALTTGMISSAQPPLRPHWLGESADFLNPAAIVNWCGVSDVNDICIGPHLQEFAVRWRGEGADASAVGMAVSPLTYVRSGLPPIITLHGDKDEIVPYSHAVRLHEALSKATVINQLITLPGAAHASLSAYLSAYPLIFKFLAQAGVNIHAQNDRG